MKKSKKYLDIGSGHTKQGEVVDLRNIPKKKTKKNIVSTKKTPKYPQGRRKTKAKDKVYLVANSETMFEDKPKGNIDVNFLNSKKNRDKFSLKEPKKLKKSNTKSKSYFAKNFSNAANNLFDKHRKVIFSKSLAFFLIIALCSVSTIQVLAFFQEDLLNKKSIIENSAEVAYKYMDSGQQSILQKDYDLASYKFGVASEKFDAAERELDILGQSVIDALSLFPVGQQVSSADHLLEAGSNIAVASEYIAYSLMPYKDSENILKTLNDPSQDTSSEGIKFTEALIITNTNLEKSLEKIILAEENLNNVKEKSLPDDIAEKVSKIKSQVPQIRYVIEKYLSFSDLILELLGHDNLKKYLFLFQNNRELRATGGFIGTYGQFDVSEGKIENIKIEGPYNVDGQLLDNIAAPEPLRLISRRLYMRDANWFADFPTSARKVSAYYEKSGQATTDGVVAVTSNFFNDLLELVGPIDMPEYDKTITYENFYDETQKQVEFEYDKEENKPKKFIADMFPMLIEKISTLDQEKWPDVLNLAINSFEKKDIQIYFKNEDLQNIIEEFGWGGEIIETNKDYLNVISTNIGGGKTDHVVKQDVYLNTDIKSDGSVINTLTISRKHQGDINKIFEDVKNVSYMRVYAPLGSTLLEAEGFDGWFYDTVQDPEEGYTVDKDIEKIESGTEIFDDTNTRISKESGKTVFSNWMGVEVGTEKVARIKYKLPFKLKIDDQNPIKSYSLLIQRQPGADSSSFFGKINVPDKWKNIWEYSSSGFIVDGYEYKSDLIKDGVLGLIFADKNFKL